MMKKAILTGALLLAFCCASVLAQDTNAPAGTNAPAAATDTTPKPDPAGTATGAAVDAQDASGTHFVVSEPAALSDDDKKDPAKVKKYADDKKAFDDYTAQAKLEPLAVKLSDSVGHNRVAINFMWTLITGFLVMFMQAGFALVETGLCRAKNASHVMAMNFMIYALGMLGFWICGFAIMFGGYASGPAPIGWQPSLGQGIALLNQEFTINILGHPFGLFGKVGFFLNPAVFDTAIFCLFLFQMVFMDTTATIPTGAMAERWNFSNFVIYGFWVGMLPYALFGNWVWGGGWLAQLGQNFGLGHGHVDFAGSSVVHQTGGMIALAGAFVIGPRLGKYAKDGTPRPIPGHNLVYVMLGTFILAFGWFGFNPGSTLAGTDNRIAIVAVNTMLASASGAFAAYLWMVVIRRIKPDPSMLCN